MKFSVNQQDLQKSLNYCQGVIEKRSTLPILSNILLDASNSKLTITATDLDLIFITEIKNSFSKNIFWVFGVVIKQKTKIKRELVSRRNIDSRNWARLFIINPCSVS